MLLVCGKVEAAGGEEDGDGTRPPVELPEASSLSRSEKFRACRFLEEEAEEVVLAGVWRERLRRAVEG